MFWMMLHFAVDAEWSVVVRRILENDGRSRFVTCGSSFLPIS